MKKKLLALLLALISIFSTLTACKKAENPAATEQTNADLAPNVTSQNSGREETNWPEDTEGQETPPSKDDSEHAYRHYNKKLQNNVPNIGSGQTLMACEDEMRYLVTFKEPIGASFRPMYSDYLPPETNAFYGIMDDNDKVLIYELGDTVAFTYAASRTEHYDVRIRQTRDVVGEGELARVGDAVLYDEIKKSDGTMSLLSIGMNERSKIAVIQYEDESDLYDDGLYHGYTLSIRISPCEETADPVRAFEELFEFSVLHNDDEENEDVAYTLDGKTVDTSTAISARNVISSVLAEFHMHLPENAENCHVYFTSLRYEKENESYDLMTGLCNRGFHANNEDVKATRGYNEWTLYAETGKWPAVYLETDIQNKPYADTTLRDNDNMCFYIMLNDADVLSEDAEEMLDAFTSIYLE